MLVPWYLITAYAYYVLDVPIVSDKEFDAMAKKLLKDYDTIEHRHKHLVTKDALKAGTLLLAEEEYPSMAKEVAIQLARAV